MEPKELNEALERFLRPQTFPLAFKFVKSKEEVPERARKIDGITICQAYNLSRKYGWTVFFDSSTTCPIGLVAFGFAVPDELYATGQLAYEGGYAESAETGRKFEEAVEKLDFGSYMGCVVSPLSRAASTPDFVAVFGNPAQILRLIHASIYRTGGAFETRILGRAACSELLEAFTRDKPRFVVPCYGDRLFGLTQDDEVAFAFPYRMAEEIARNLEETHKRGIRYPIPTTALRLPLKLPESYERSARAMKRL
jgi:uncharacterized protein (DUF169 family)